MTKKKPTFKLRIFKSFIGCSFHWQMRQFQVSKPRFWASSLSTRSSSAKPTLYHSSGISGVPSDPSSPMSNFTKLVLVVWGSGDKSCRRSPARPKNWGNKRPTVIKKSIRFFIIRAYCLYPNSFKQSWLAVRTKILWPAILASKRLANCWLKKTIGQPSATMSRPTWKAVTFVKPSKQFVTSPTVIFNSCLYQRTNRKTFPRTLWPIYRYQSIGRKIVTIPF